MPYGVTPQGFNRKRFEDIVASMQASARELYGNDVDLTDASPLSQFLQVVAFELSLNWMATEDTYNGAYVDTSEGQNLDRAVKYSALVRRPATKAQGTIRFSGIAGGTVLDNSVVQTDGDSKIQFRVLTGGTLVGNPAILDVAVEAVEAGNVGNVAANTVTQIVNPMPGVTTVTNPDPITGGLDLESDLELRDRFLSFPVRGGSSADAILAKLINPEDTPDVLDARVFQNVSMETDANGVPAKSVWAVVFGGADEDIAASIHDVAPAGIYTHGDVAVQVTDYSSQARTVRFSRAAEKQTYVTLTITTDATFPTDGSTQVQDQVIAYIGGTDSESIFHRGLGMGEDIVAVRLLAAALKVTGVVDASVTLGFDLAPVGSANLSIAPTEIAKTALNQVVVNVV